VTAFDWKQVGPGTELTPWVAPPVTRTDIVRYQGASGDFDAAHHDDAHAQRFGYPGVFSLGMLHAGMLAGWLANYCPPDRIRRFHARFGAVVYPGDVLSYKGRVEQVRIEKDGRWADLELACERRDGVVVTRAWASVLIE
jgi:acyl dehydratase